MTDREQIVNLQAENATLREQLVAALLDALYALVAGSPLYPALG